MTVQLHNNCSFDITVKSSKNTHIEKLTFDTVYHISGIALAAMPPISKSDQQT